MEQGRRNIVDCPWCATACGVFLLLRQASACLAGRAVIQDDLLLGPFPEQSVVHGQSAIGAGDPEKRIPLGWLRLVFGWCVHGSSCREDLSRF